MADRIGLWMPLRSGGLYYPMDPRPEDVRAEDIAEHLSKECRYNGACAGFYSVAEHCYLGSYLVPQEHALQFLVHDAPEYVCKDAHRALKAGLGRAYADIEHKNWLVICTALGVNPELHPCVHAADAAMAAAELVQLFRPGEIPPSDRGTPPDVVIHGWEWHKARDMWMARYLELAAA